MPLNVSPLSPSLAKVFRFVRSIRSPYKKSISIRKTPSPEIAEVEVEGQGQNCENIGGDEHASDSAYHNEGEEQVSDAGSRSRSGSNASNLSIKFDLDCID